MKKGRKFWQASRITSTLGSYYKKKKHTYAEDFHDFHDVNLRRIFAERSKDDSRPVPAYRVIRRRRKMIIDSVSRWTGEKKYIVDGLIKTLAQRCKELNLIVGSGEGEVMVQISAYVTALMMNYMYTGRLRGKYGNKQK